MARRTRGAEREDLGEQTELDVWIHYCIGTKGGKDCNGGRKPKKSTRNIMLPSYQAIVWKSTVGKKIRHIRDSICNKTPRNNSLSASYLVTLASKPRSLKAA